MRRNRQAINTLDSKSRKIFINKSQPNLLNLPILLTAMYLKWQEKTITDFSDENINSFYNEGYLFTRESKGRMYQTRSLRIDLSKFKLSSENRRVIKKTEELKLTKFPLPYADYHWSIGKLGKDFYETKFGLKTFSANKIKELMTEPDKSNFNCVFVYSVGTDTVGAQNLVPSPTNTAARAENFLPLQQTNVGYCIALETNDLIHYCYPFYVLQATSYKLPPNTGLGMMLRAIELAQDKGKKYLYLGSFQRPTDTYKLQFEGLEWFDGHEWQTSLEELKKMYDQK